MQVSVFLLLNPSIISVVTWWCLCKKTVSFSSFLRFVPFAQIHCQCCVGIFFVYPQALSFSFHFLSLFSLGTSSTDCYSQQTLLGVREIARLHPWYTLVSCLPWCTIDKPSTWLVPNLRLLASSASEIPRRPWFISSSYRATVKIRERKVMLLDGRSNVRRERWKGERRSIWMKLDQPVAS